MFRCSGKQKTKMLADRKREARCRSHSCTLGQCDGVRRQGTYTGDRLHLCAGRDRHYGDKRTPSTPRHREETAALSIVLVTIVRQDMAIPILGGLRNAGKSELK